MCTSVFTKAFFPSLYQICDGYRKTNPLEAERFFDEIVFCQQQSCTNPALAFQQLNQFSDKLCRSCANIYQLALPIITAEKSLFQLFSLNPLPDVKPYSLSDLEQPSQSLLNIDSVLPSTPSPFELEEKLPNEPTVPLPSVAGFIATFSHRPLSEDGYAYTKADHDLDKALLIKLLRAHNEQFLERIIRVGANTGETERLDVTTGNTLFVRADIHSDVATVIGQLEVLQAEGFLDAEYRCKEGFHMLFLGDFCDRGQNDIETLTVLLKFRMENPNAVHLIRGNHEDLSTQIDGNFSEEWRLLLRQSVLFSTFYNSLPVAICAGDMNATEKGRREFIHFSHGSVQTSLDLSPITSGEEVFLPVASGVIKPRTHPKDASDKQSRAIDKIQAITSQIGYLEEQPFMHLWGQIGLITEPSPRGRGYILSSKDLHTYAQSVATKTGVVKAFFEGHVHKFSEFLAPRKEKEKTKVFNTTLPTAIMTGNLKKIFANEVLQGVLFTVAPKVEHWTKEAIVFHDQKFQRTRNAIGMYQSIPLT